MQISIVLLLSIYWKKPMWSVVHFTYGPYEDIQLTTIQTEDIQSLNAETTGGQGTCMPL